MSAKAVCPSRLLCAVLLAVFFCGCSYVPPSYLESEDQVAGTMRGIPWV